MCGFSNADARSMPHLHVHLQAKDRGKVLPTPRKDKADGQGKFQTRWGEGMIGVERIPRQRNDDFFMDLSNVKDAVFEVCPSPSSPAPQNAVGGVWLWCAHWASHDM